MPHYAFKCPICHRGEVIVLPMKDRHQCPRCPYCSTDSHLVTQERDMASEGASTPNQEYEKTIYSESMGVRPDQVAERRARFPHIPHTDDGRVIIKNLQEQNRFSKDLGFTDQN